VYSVLNVCKHIKIYLDFNKQNKLGRFYAKNSGGMVGRIDSPMSNE